MTRKTDTMLKQLSALKDYLEEHAEELSDTQSQAIQVAIDGAWSIADRRSARR